jgi:hypothetical protein
MPAAIAAFFDSLPTWVQASVAIAIAAASIVIAWKGILPHFIHEVPVVHEGVLYRRNKAVIHQGVVKKRGPGFYPILPGLYKYQNTDMRSQTTVTEGFKLDFEKPFMTYHVDGLTINWLVCDSHKYQTGSADSEAFVRERLREACRAALIATNNATISKEEVTAWCRNHTPTLADIGVELQAVMITSGSFETRNHRFPKDEIVGKTVVMADEL